MYDDPIKRCGMYALIVFNIVVIVLMIYYINARGGMILLHAFDFVKTIFFAAVAGVITFFVALKLGG
jgi:hypothetical protein